MNAKATIITGPQGSGKNTRARAIAAALGPFTEISWSQLYEQFGLESLHRKAVVIVDEVPAMEHCLSKIKGLISSPKITINRKVHAPLEIYTPSFIFCTSSKWECGDGRRFDVIDLWEKVPLYRDIPSLDYNFPAEQNERIYGWSAHMGHRCVRCANPLGPFGIGHGTKQEQWGCVDCGVGVCFGEENQPSINAAADMFVSMLRTA
ncbi:DUF5906 domain-containing protein [Rhodanobacter sp. AS-Z3]|uniref:primase-helicase family protein n=1 Tax=Rhodanobacter sp. AS-Z3 TaxID=3031330 RepID=UPI00247956B2|nr:primase-helicase family protein [Rhodanobacter sp. AS-Z3]WEN13689.1 DUF5906 domain-containing protein [Rhodanobacter sp. AS-Z3]